MLRFIEAANQVRRAAGEHQIDGARTALAQAYGGGGQYFAMGVLRSTEDSQVGPIGVIAAPPSGVLAQRCS